VLHPRDPRLEGGRGGASDFTRDRARWDAPGAGGAADPGGDVLHLHPARGDALGDRARKADFGAGVGRGDLGVFVEWTDQRLAHELRAQPNLDQTAGGRGDTNARRRERMARLAARQPRRGQGDQRPDPARPGKIVIA
jgi:hypothetical protein